MRRYLQTAGLACTLGKFEPVSSVMYRAGVQMITPVDSMSLSYLGEPHDGGFALPRFLRRVSMRIDEPMNGIVSMQELRRPNNTPPDGPIQETGVRVLTKSDVTTGEPVYCGYSQVGYDRYIVEPGVKSMMALGLDPEKT